MKERIEFCYRLYDRFGDLMSDIYYSREDIASAVLNELDDEEDSTAPLVYVQIYNEENKLIKLEYAPFYIKNKYGYGSPEYYEYNQAIDDEEGEIWSRVRKLEEELKKLDETYVTIELKKINRSVQYTFIDYDDLENLFEELKKDYGYYSNCCIDNIEDMLYENHRCAHYDIFSSETNECVGHITIKDNWVNRIKENHREYKENEEDE